MSHKQNFDKGWKFHLGDLPVDVAVKSGMAGGITDCEEIEDGEWLRIAFFDERKKAGADEDGWQDVSIPHDWCVEGEYYNDGGAVKHHRSHGYLPTGVGFYRKMFDIPSDSLGKKIGLAFDGVFRNSTVWVNGHIVMRHQSGYTGFHCDITDVLRYGNEGKNVVLVKVDARDYEGWWYEGAGIYRHVWLITSDRLHFKRHGVFVTTPLIEKDRAEVKVQTVVCNTHFERKDYSLRINILNESGHVIGEVACKGSTDAFDEGVFSQELSLPEPRLWSPETPHLYSLVAQLWDDKGVVDTFTTKFGVRSVAFDAQRGFLLNGAQYLIKGTCNHQDFAGIGVALPDCMIEYKIKLLKEMGCNAYRSAHHPATPELLEICDRLGMLVLDENRKLDSSEEGLRELRELIERGRNHPSIFMWCLENEEILEGTLMGTRILKTLTGRAHHLDSTRPVTAAMNHGWNDNGYSDVVDVVGYNYGQREGQDVNDRARFPHRIMLGTESASCAMTRGIYHRDDERGFCPEYGTHIPEWACSVEKAWTDVVNNPFLSGVFIWTGFDYRGEPTPYDWPCINSHFGVMDTCGFPKSSYFYLKSVWTDAPMLHIMPHWNWEMGREIDVRVFSNCEQVELYLNHNSLGRKSMPQHSHLQWQVPYEPGELLAIGYIGDKEITRRTVRTAGEAAAVWIEADRLSVRADGCDTVCIRTYIKDRDGNLVPYADNAVHFKVEGQGRILGVGNGNPSSHEPDKAHKRKAFNGKCLLLVQSCEKDGEIIVTASAEGLTSCTLKVIAETNH